MYTVGIVSTLREAVVRKRSRGEKEIYRGGTASSGTLFYANRVSFFLVSRRLLNGEEESTVTPRVPFITISQMQSVPRELTRTDISCRPSPSRGYQ